MPEQLKIAMISIHSCPIGKLGGKDTGGMNVYIVEFARELGRKGHMVDIYTRVHQSEHEQLVNIGQNVRLIHLETGGDEEIPKMEIYPYLQKFAGDVENFRQSNDLHYHLLHSHYWLSGLVGTQLQTWWRIPHMVMFHTLGAVKNSIGIGEVEPALRIESERQVVGNCERIIAATEREKEDLIRYYGAPEQRISIIPCGINLDLFTPIDKEIARKNLDLDHQNVILFVGRIEPLKGLEQLLRALSQITGAKTPILMIVGGDEHSQDEIQGLQRLARELHIEDQVSFLGSVAQERLPMFYSAADICVIPSHYESFGMVALESLACGTSIVATDVGIMRHVTSNSNTGRLVTDNSPHHLATRISELLWQSDEQTQHALTRRAATAEFKWSNIANMMLHEYDRVIGDYSAQVSL